MQVFANLGIRYFVKVALELSSFEVESIVSDRGSFNIFNQVRKAKEDVRGFSQRSGSDD
jgi:hypothetical protein